MSDKKRVKVEETYAETQARRKVESEARREKYAKIKTMKELQELVFQDVKVRMNSGEKPSGFRPWEWRGKNIINKTTPLRYDHFDEELINRARELFIEKNPACLDMIKVKEEEVEKERSRIAEVLQKYAALKAQLVEMEVDLRRNIFQLDRAVEKYQNGEEVSVILKDHRDRGFLSDSELAKTEREIDNLNNKIEFEGFMRMLQMVHENQPRRKKPTQSIAMYG